MTGYRKVIVGSVGIVALTVAACYPVSKDVLLLLSGAIASIYGAFVYGNKQEHDKT